MNSLRLDGVNHSIRSGKLDDNRRVAFALLPEVDVIATLPAMSGRFDRGTSFFATFSISGLSDAWLLFWERPITHPFVAIYRFASILPPQNDAIV